MKPITVARTVQQADQPLVRLTAGDVMTRDVATVVATSTVGQAMTLMRTLGIRHLPVLGAGDGRFAGIVDERMVASMLLTAGGFGSALEQPVSAAMTQYVPQVSPGDPLQRVAHLLPTSRCDAVVVIDVEEHLLGIITMVDVVSAVALGSVEQPSLPVTGQPPRPVAVGPDLSTASIGSRS